MPHLSEHDASRLTAELYGLHMTARGLPGEYDANFHLTSDDGRAFVLKVMRVGQAAEVIDLQCRALALLAERVPTLNLPRVCPTMAGEPFATASIQGMPQLIWLLSYVPGCVLAEISPHSSELLHSIGRLLGQLDAALIDFAHPAAQRELKWDLARAGWIRKHLGAIADPSGRVMVERCLSEYENAVVPALAGLRSGIIHGDANDFNLLVSAPDIQPRQAVSVIDFGDMLLSKIVCEPAIAAAYALLGKRDPLAAAAQVIAGYHDAFPLTEAEIALLFPLIRARLAVSVTNSAQRKLLEPDDAYITISEAPAWAALAQLDALNPRFAHYTFRNACGLPPVPESAAVVAWLQSHAANFAPVLGIDLCATPTRVFDLSVGSLFLGADPSAAATPVLSERIFGELRAADLSVGVGRYDEARLIYATPAFASGTRPTDARRTIHLGIDLFVEAGAPVYAPLAGEVCLAVNNNARLDYGPLVILKHAPDDGPTFFTLYGHLGADALERCRAGQPIARGEQIGSIGAPPSNGDWPPHLHFQIITDLLELDRDFPGVAYASQRAIWTSLSPDPNLLLGIPADRFPAPEPSPADTLDARRARIGRNLSISYQQPLKVVRGWMQYLYDESGRAYLDVYNNVPIVGHSHPRVVYAAQAQLALLNTNTRYLHDNLTRYAERLTALMPDPLRVCFVLNSASEANELALRLARTYTGYEHLIVLDAAYHGHTGGLIEISPYKFNGPGGSGPRPWVHIAPIPDDYRGPYKRDDPAAGMKYASHVGAIVERLQAAGQGLAAYIAETLPSVGGQIVFPPGYLAEAYRHVRAAGGLCIADEVQVGFGRLGTHFWGFETQGVVPDIVVLGKPIGNGFPLAAVVTTPAIAAAFDNGMEFFSTFGGNPVACAAGLAVLDVLRDQQLQAHALRVGSRLLAGLRALIERHPIVGDARGLGLFLGLELVRNRATLAPAADAAGYLVNRLRDCGILAGTDGPYHNVMKIRPPLPFNDDDADLLLATLDELLREDVFRYHEETS